MINIPDIKLTFGHTYFLGFTEKMKFDQLTNKKTEERESYVCRLSSSELQGQIEVMVLLCIGQRRAQFTEEEKKMLSFTTDISGIEIPEGVKVVSLG